MNYLQNRYGISALSKKFKINAVPNEIMIDKETGEVQVKSPNGNIFSYNYISRLNAHIDTVKFNAYNADVYGKIYDIVIENKDLPMTVNKEENLLDGDLGISISNFKAFMLSIDLDSINPSRKISHMDICEIPIILKFKYENSLGTTEEMIVSDTLYKICRTVFSRNDFPSEFTNLRLSSLEISNSDLFDGFEQFILHSLILNLEEV